MCVYVCMCEFYCVAVKTIVCVCVARGPCLCGVVWCVAVVGYSSEWVDLGGMYGYWCMLGYG